MAAIHPRFRGFPADSGFLTVQRMREFLAEAYIPRTTSGELTAVETVSASAEALRTGGQYVRLVRSLLVAEDETCFYIFEADSESVVHEVGERSRLRFTRISEIDRDWSATFAVTDPEPRPPTARPERSNT